MWRTINEVAIPDIRKFVRNTVATSKRDIHIGTDSLQAGKITRFVTVLVLLLPGKGGRVAYRRVVVPRITSLRERLLREVYHSVSLGLELNDLLPSASDLTLHVDANPIPKFRSSRYVHELVGMVVGQGFKAVVKPESWAATHTADRIARGANSESARRVNA
jgi:hypothetical protein